MCVTQNVASAESMWMRAGRWTWLFQRVEISDNKKGKKLYNFVFTSFFFDFSSLSDPNYGTSEVR